MGHALKSEKWMNVAVFELWSLETTADLHKMNRGCVGPRGPEGPRGQRGQRGESGVGLDAQQLLKFGSDVRIVVGFVQRMEGRLVELENKLDHLVEKISALKLLQ